MEGGAGNFCALSGGTTLLAPPCVQPEAIPKPLVWNLLQQFLYVGTWIKSWVIGD